MNPLKNITLRCFSAKKVNYFQWTLYNRDEFFFEIIEREKKRTHNVSTVQTTEIKVIVFESTMKMGCENIERTDVVRKTTVTVLICCIWR